MSEFVKEQLDSIDMNRLRGAVKLLNDTGLLTTKVKVAGLTKVALAEVFMTSVEDLAAQEGIEFPENMILFYNVLAGMMEDGTTFTEPEITTETKTEEPPAPAKEKKEPKVKKEKKEPKTPVSKKAANFEDIKAKLANPKSGVEIFDSLCLGGGKILDLIAAFVKTKPEYGTLTTKSSVQAHIKYRENRGYVYEKKDDDYIKMVGFKPVS